MSFSFGSVTRPMRPRAKIIAWTAVAIAVTMTAGILAARFHADPAGRFHSYPVIPHSYCDVLAFSNGTVTLQTCCGDESWGTYQRAPDGHWVWTSVHGSKTLLKTNVYNIALGTFSATFTQKQTLSSFTLRRRLFTKVPL